MKWKTGGLLVTALAAGGALLFFPAQAAAGAGKGVSYSLDILVPSLYPFMVLAVFVVKSGLSEQIGSHLEELTQRLFRLPGSCAVSVLMSVIGGFPAGARSVASLYEQGAIDARQAERMLYFCVNAGPSFVITAVGVGFLKSPQDGALLFATQLTVFLLLGLISGALGRADKSVPITRKKKTAPSAAQALIASAADGAASTLNMCCFVILFACLLNLLRIFVTSPLPSLLLSAVLEVTGGCSDLAKSGAPLWAVAFAVGWGGICVHFQVFAFTAGIPYRRSRFFFFRFLQGLLSGGVAFLLSSLFPESVETVAGATGAVSAGLSGPAPASAALLLLCAALLCRVPRETLEFGEMQCYNRKQ